ncbi:hypothetical protein OJ998_03030 [Solirubrobacter taibaiensis]|nr:hypothetical protein [Solirubrobacter taibaiensis]
MGPIGILLHELEAPEVVGIGLAIFTIACIVWSFLSIDDTADFMAEHTSWADLDHLDRFGDGGSGSSGGDGGDSGGGGE